MAIHMHLTHMHAVVLANASVAHISAIFSLISIANRDAAFDRPKERLSVSTILEFMKVRNIYGWMQVDSKKYIA